MVRITCRGDLSTRLKFKLASLNEDLGVKHKQSKLELDVRRWCLVQSYDVS